MSQSKDKTSASDRTDLLREIAIFDYVAGRQSDSVKRNFERKLEQDSALKAATEEEFELRRNMQEAGKETPVSMSNFDALLEMINQQDKVAQEESDGANAVSSTKVTPISKAKKNSLIKYYASAASIAIVAVVFSGVYLDSSAPKFQTLSDAPASQALNFTQLASQSRLAKLTFNSSASDAQIDALLRQFELSSFDAGAAQNQRFVTAKKSISKSDLARLREDPRVQNAELFVLSNGE